MKKILFILVGIYFYQNSWSQINKNGTQFITNYSPKTYQASEQNWAIVQDNRDVMYFGNNDNGILEYDGVNWRKIPVKNKSIVRSFAKDSLGTIYVGAVGDFGMLTPKSNGKLIYESFVYKLDSLYKDFNDIWKIYVRNDGVYFCSLKYIFHYFNDSIVAYNLKDGAFFTFLIKDELFIGNYLDGLKKFENDSLFLINGGHLFSKKGIYTLNPYNQEMLVGTYPDGLYIFSPEKGTIVDRFQNSPANSFLIKNQLYCSQVINKNEYVFGTIHNGTIKMDQSGNVLNHYNKSSGLQDETVTSIYIDKNKNTWLSLNNGISKLEQNNALSKFDEKNGLKGSVLDLCEFNNNLIVATTVGVFYLSIDKDGYPTFIDIEEVSKQTWSLLPIQINGYNKLLVGTINGLYEIDRNFEVKYIDQSIRDKKEKEGKNYIQKLYRSNLDSTIVHVALWNGAFSIKLKNNRWVREKSYKVNNANIQDISEDESGNLWLSTVYDGLIKMTNDSVRTILNKENGLSSNKQITFLNYDDKLLFGTESGIYQFDESNKTFSPFNEFSSDYLEKRIGTFKLNQDYQHDIWISAFNGNRKWVERAKEDEFGNYKRDTLPFTRLPNEQFDVIYHDKNGITWFGSSSGLYSFDTKFERDYNDEYQTLIRKVQINEDSTLFEGTYFKKERNKVLITNNQPKELVSKIDYSIFAIML
jgi:ligand-binding sensor domain-containing protein